MLSGQEETQQRNGSTGVRVDSLDSTKVSAQDVALTPQDSSSLNTPALSPQKSIRPLKWGLITLLLAGLVTVPAALYLNKQRTQVNAEALASLTVPVKTEDLTVRINASGVVQPVRRVNLSPKTQGRLAKLYVEQGDRVEAGQVIAEMEGTEIEAQLLQAQARLAKTQANLEKLEAGSRSEEIAAAQARVNQTQAKLAEMQAGTRSEEVASAQAQLSEAQFRLADAQTGSLQDEISQAKFQLEANRADLKLAKERLQRNQALRQEGAISQDALEEYLRDERRLGALVSQAQQRISQLKQSQSSQVEQLQATVEQQRQNLLRLQNGARPQEVAQVQAEVAEAQSKLDELLNGTRPEDIAASQAEVREAQGQVQYYQTQLEDTKVRAPFSGIIAQRYAVEGSFVTPATSASEASSATSTSIVALAQDLEVLAKIPEADIGQIKPNQTVEIVADTFPDQVFEGRVQLIAPEAVKERDVTLFQARIEIISGQDKLQSGMNVDLQFLGDKLDQALVVPTVAIVTNKGQTGVLIPNEKNQPEFQPVTVGSNIGNQIQILDGVQVGEQVFIELPQGQKLEKIINSEGIE
ncbi:MAG: HlyD family efflux transporter periplasmic adaptor subunit [Oscillatoriales cyanobacterium RM2_1_1]|nr:HlyD family efflux transporter periplasmic adaptor subunit [Oscillatoriales cyanobacterium RM2_1_1]